MNVTTFNSLQFGTKHFKHAMNAITGGSLKYLCNVNYLHFEYESLNGSSNLYKNIQLHLTWKVTAISPQQYTFQETLESGFCFSPELLM